MPNMIFAAEAGAGSASAIDNVITLAGKVVEFSGTLLVTMIENPIYGFLFAAGFVGVGLGIVRKLKRAAVR